jgi:hypothetical protein
MRYRPDTPEGVNEVRMLREGERIYWHRQSPQLERNITIFPETLTPEQQQRLNEIEQELVTMAYDATEERKTKTILTGKGRA